jgi:hypothetical protein
LSVKLSTVILGALSSDNPVPRTASGPGRFTFQRTVIVKKFFENPIVSALASLKLTVPLLIIFAVAIAKATFIENDWGAEGARALVYNALWFEILLSLFCLNLLLQLFKNMPYKPRQTGFVIVHVSMIVILVSAGITRWFGYEGSMHIREGQSSSFIWSRETHVQLTVGDDFASYPVRLFRPGEVTSKKLHLGDATYRVAVENYWPHFEERFTAAESGPAALKIAAVGGGGMEEMFLIEGTPDKARGVDYRLVRGDAPPATGSGLSFALGADGVLRCLADVDVAISDMSSGEVTVSLTAGEVFAVEDGSLYRSGDSWISFVVQEVFPHVQRRPGMSDDDRAPPAALISVVGPGGERAETIVVKESTRPGVVVLGDTEAFVKLGAIRIPVPYSVHLDDFLLLNYPGSRNPASYESHVKLYDPEKGIDGEPVRIYMNHPMDHRGFKHFQSSYDTDEQGTILSVNYDPGKLPTYFGYFLISLGFVLVFMRDLLWPRKDLPKEGAGDEV